MSRKNAAKAAASSGRAKIMLIALAVMVATAVALQLTGVIDLGSTLGFSDPTNQIPEGNFGTPAPTNGANKGNTNTTNTNNTNAGDEPDGGNTTIKVVDSNPNEGQEDPAEARRRLEQEGINENLDAARNYLADNQCAVPRGVLEALAVKHPENIEIKQTLLDVYTCLKLKDEARDLKKSIEDLKGSAPEDDGKKRRRRKKDQ